MTYPDFRRLLLAAGETSDPTAYFAEVGGSIPGSDIHLLPIIHDMGQEELTIQRIAQACDLSVRRLGMELGISYSTFANWAQGIRTPTPWQLPLIAYAAVSLSSSPDPDA